MKVHIFMKNKAGSLPFGTTRERKVNNVVQDYRIIAQFKFSSHCTVQCLNFQFYIYILYMHTGDNQTFSIIILP